MYRSSQSAISMWASRSAAVAFCCRTGETVTCRYDEDMKRQLGERLEAFREALLKGDFPAAAPSEENEDPCRYCKYIGICGMAEEQNVDGEGGEI